MAGFTDYNDLVQELTVNGKYLTWDFFKVAPANAQGAGNWQTLWKATGTPGAGADPAAGSASVNSGGTAHTNEAGSINFADQSPDTKHILSLGACANQNCTLLLLDRLVGVSGLSLASTGNKNVNNVALPRYSGSSAAVVSAWLEITTATTTTPAVVSLNTYTNEAGTASRVGGTITFPAAATVLHTMLKLPIQAGDKGIRTVETLNVGTAASVGAATLLLCRELARIPLIANQWNEKDFVLQTTALPRVFDGSSLSLAILASGAVTTTVWGTVQLAFG
jgi:hypothetical protein